MRQTLPAEKRIELVHVNLMRSKQFAAFAGLFMVGKTTVSDVVKTAMTNGRDAHYGRSFVDSLTDRELAFLVMHENMHKCYRHLTTWKKLHDENHALANMACDYVINITLVDLDPDEALISMPRDRTTGKLAGLYDTRFRGMSAKQVFDILKEEQEDQKTDPGDGEGDGDDAQSDGSDSPQDNSAGLDEHDWAGAKQMAFAGCAHAARVSRISRATSSNRPARNRPRLITMSISSAPASTASATSRRRTSSGYWPLGKPVATAATFTPLSPSDSRAVRTSVG